MGAAVWLCPHERTPLTWLVVAVARCCCTRTWCNYSPPSFAFRLSVTVTRSEAMPSKRPTHSRRRARARSLSSLFPSSLPLSLLFTHCFFRFEAAASQNRQGITPRARPSLAPVPLCLLCITAQQGENKGITRAWPELSSRNFSADPNAP